MTRSHPNARKGQALLAITFSLLFLFAVMGLSIDLGWAYYLKQRVQTGADAAATAAAVYAANNGDTCGTVTCNTSYTCAGVTPPTNSLQAGCLYATTDGPPSMSASLIENNTSLGGNSPSMWIKATVSTTAPNFFLFGSGFHVASIAAQSTAGVTTVPPGTCVYQLSNTSINQAVLVSGAASLSATGCGLFLNSTAPYALTVSGSATVTASTVQVVGGDSITGTSTVTPTPTTGASVVTDPFASLPAPSWSGCNQTSDVIAGSTVTTISPGVYCNGLSIGGVAQVTLNPGTYIINGGGLTISNSAVVTGSGVTFYLTGSSSYAAAPVTISGAAIVTLSAPTSGTYRGVIFFQDSSHSYSSANNFGGSASSVITGSYYFPTTSLLMSGASTTAVYAALIAKTISVTGSAVLKNDTTGQYTGLAKSTVSLIQ